MSWLHTMAIGRMGILVLGYVIICLASGCVSQRPSDSSYAIGPASADTIEGSLLGNHNSDIVAISTAADAPVAVSVDDRNELVIWDLQAAIASERRTVPGGPIERVAVSANGQVYAWSQGGAIHLSTFHPGSARWDELPSPAAHSSNVAGLRFLESGSDRVAIVYMDGLLRVWSVNRGAQDSEAQLRHAPYPIPLPISPEGFVALLHTDGPEVYRLPNGESVAKLRTAGSVCGITNDSETVLIADLGQGIAWGLGRRQSSTVTFWRWQDREGSAVSSVLLPLSRDEARADRVLAITPLGEHKAAIVSTEGLRFIDVSSHDVLARCHARFDVLVTPSKVASLPDHEGVLIAVGKTVRIWRATK